MDEGLIGPGFYPQPNEWTCGPFALKHALLALGRMVDVNQISTTARTHWWSSYRRKSGEPVEIEFDNIYVLRIATGQEPQIFAYVTGDEQQVLKDHGLI